MRNDSNLIFKDVEEKLSKVLGDELAKEFIEMHKGFVKGLRGYAEHSGKLARSANMKSNDNSRDLNSGILKIDNLLNRLNNLAARVRYLELPWYRRLWKKLTK